MIMLINGPIWKYVKDLNVFFVCSSLKFVKKINQNFWLGMSDA